MFDDTLAMHLRSAYLTFHRSANSILEESGVTADQFVVMSILAEEPGVTQRGIVDRAYSDPNTIGAILKRLEDKSLIAREIHPTDGRAWRVFLTENGRKLQQLALQHSRELHQKLSGLFSPKDEKALKRLLSQIPPAMLETRASSPEETD